MWTIQHYTSMELFIVEEPSHNQGPPRTPRAGEQGFLWVQVYVYVCSSTGVDFGLQTLFQKKNA